MDWHDTENNVASEVPVERFKSKEVEIMKFREAFMFLRRWLLETRMSRTTSHFSPPESREFRRGRSTAYCGR